MVTKLLETTSKRTDMSIPGRKEVLRLRVVPGTTDRLDRLATLFGLPSSTLAALAVGEWITSKESALSLNQQIVDRLAGIVGTEVSKLTSGMAKVDDLQVEKSP